MKANILSITGVNEALLGLGLSHGLTSQSSLDHLIEDSYNFVPSLHAQLVNVAHRLKGKKGGHDKFLRCITIYLDISAPLYWWKQFDQYKVGTTSQSESSMHTLMRTPITADMFEMGATILGRDRAFTELVETLEHYRVIGDFDRLNKLLPHSFIQRRIICVNAEVLRNIISQRRKHKIIEWRKFVSDIEAQANAMHGGEYIVG